jgi:exopolyphosphatase/guanosine-5'-triphosphate,3'-diphosphate pyrophosphatase
MTEQATVPGQTLAALDLGSNSFHMVIAEADSAGGLQIVDRVKDMVRLNAGLDAEGNLSEEARVRALDCLERFSQRLRGIPSHRIRAVGTNTFRAAHNSADFLLQAEAALDHQISIISGHEEARLVYLGAAFSLESSGRRRLVIDIGGGSTELIIGRGYQAVTMDSLYMGCVSMSRRFFPNGRITAERLERARAAASLELEPIVQRYQRMGWQEVVGTSGTIRAVDDLSRALGLNRDWLSRESFENMERWLIRRGRAEKLDLLPEQRRPVFAGGFAIIAAIFSALGLERLDCTSGALREGVLYDLNGRLHDSDSRDQGVDSLVSRFSLDREQAARLRRICFDLLDQVAAPWKLDLAVCRKQLGWACQLHEIGTVISFNQNHKHGSYIIENMDIDGFSRQQQRVLALLVRSHRQKFPVNLFGKLPKAGRDQAVHAAILLRLAFAFSRGRTDVRLPVSVIAASEHMLELALPREWMADHPLTMMDLEAEVEYLARAGYRLVIRPDA